MAEGKDKGNERDMKKEYEAMQSKNGLPALKELDLEFDIGELPQTDFILRAIVGKIGERIDFALKILEGTVQPENHIADMQEAEHLSDADKRKVMELFKKFSYYEKDFVIKELDYDENASAELIKQFYKEWREMKPDFLRIIASLRDTWKGKDKSEHGYSYFG